MKSNVGNTDRTVRIIAGLLIIGLGFYFQSWWGAIGIVPLVTAFMRWCRKKFSFQVSPFGKGGLRGILRIISLRNLPLTPPESGLMRVDSTRFGRGI
jgi:hypothetical protein